MNFNLSKNFILYDCPVKLNFVCYFGREHLFSVPVDGNGQLKDMISSDTWSHLFRLMRFPGNVHFFLNLLE